jgi:N,N'-diacetyllegionaminate synthase
VGVASRESNMSNVTIIAEAGVNHNGDVDRALEMVDIAADAGADAVKFQTFSTDLLVSASAPTAAYQQSAVGVARQEQMLRGLELTRAAHHRIVERCALRGIEFMSTPFDWGAAEFLVSIGMSRVKVPSGELTNDGFLRRLAGLGLPLIISTGMATLEEVQHAMGIIEQQRRRERTSEPSVVLLHCTSSYPAAPTEVNLRAMRTMADSLGVPVGYSDHTLGINAAVAAVALGAVVIEKHFTLDRTLPGPDHAASLEPDGLRSLVAAIREVESMLGSPDKRPSASELPIRDVARRSVAAARSLCSGQQLTGDDLICLRPGNGIPPGELQSLIGRTILRDVGGGTLLSWEWIG